MTESNIKKIETSEIEATLAMIEQHLAGTAPMNLPDGFTTEDVQGLRTKLLAALEEAKGDRGYHLIEITEDDAPAVLYKATSLVAIDITPADGKEFTAKELQGYVGGTFDIQRLPGMNKVMVINDNGKSDQLPKNENASMIWAAAYPIHEFPINNDQTIVGDAIVCDPALVGFDKEDEE